MTEPTIPYTSTDSPAERVRTYRIARLVLATFVFTFIISRVMVYLIMTNRVHSLYMFVGTTHVHHLNYGIFLLSGVGADLLFRGRPEGLRLKIVSVLYGIGLGLTFDEFGMWLHLGGGYWQSCSFDAVVIISAMLGLLAVAPEIKRFRSIHWTTSVLLLAAIVMFTVILARMVHHAERYWGPGLIQLDVEGRG